MLEPYTCEYEAIFNTPGACSAAGLKQQHELLTATAVQLGVPYSPSADLLAVLAKV